MESNGNRDLDGAEAANGTGNTSHHDHEKQPAWRNIIENFSFVWFTVSMDTGILGIILHNLPYEFHGVGILAAILYVLNLVLFIVFTSIYIIRIFMFPRKVKDSLVTDIDELSLSGCAPVAFLTLAAQTCLVVSQAYWGGHAFTMVAYVMWWIGVAWAVIDSTFTPAIMCDKTDLYRLRGFYSGV